MLGYRQEPEEGPTDKDIERIREFLKEKGEIFYIRWPSYCGRCGGKYPPMFRVPDEMWNKYVEPYYRKKRELCWDCFNEIVTLSGGTPEELQFLATLPSLSDKMFAAQACHDWKREIQDEKPEHMPWVWPLKGCRPLFPDYPGTFAAQRKHDRHTGIDLYCERGTSVVAVEPGTVICIEDFTGSNVVDEPSSWWNDTKAVLVEGPSGIVVYGEIEPRVLVGDKVRAGDLVAVVETPVLKEFKGRPMTMLHIELLSPGTKGIMWWRNGEDMPKGLRNPKRFLQKAAGVGATHFVLDRYNGEDFR